MKTASLPHYTVLTEGSFGAAVGRRLGTTIDIHDFLQAPQSDSDFIAVALSHKRIDALYALDDWCHSQQKSWAVSFLADRYLYCGPHFGAQRPSTKGCFRCFYKRDLTHLDYSREPKREIAIDHHFNRQPHAEVAGFTQGSVGMAAAFLQAAASGKIAHGRLRRINLLDHLIDDTEVLAIHHCPRCSPNAGKKAFDATYSDLAEELKTLLT